MNKITAPFTDDQVEALNKYQTGTSFHPFTCCSYDDCKRGSQDDQGILIASNEGWVCPCGKWKQNWAWAFMLFAPNIA